MADDLDDFFDEIEEVAQEAVKEDEDGRDGDGEGSAAVVEAEEEGEPPAKKMKASSDKVPVPVPLRPRGVVVAAANSAVVTRPHDTNTDAVDVARHPADTTATSTTNGPLPTTSVSAIPPPPPPPPLPPSQQQQAAADVPKKPIKRMAAGKTWTDTTLDEWPANDFRIFVGNLDKSVIDQQLYDHYKKYASLAKAKIVCDPKGVSKGYGFCSFLQPLDCAKAIRETDQTWLGSRPIRVKRSDWKDRNLNQVMKKNKKQQKQRQRMGL